MAARSSFRQQMYRAWKPGAVPAPWTAGASETDSVCPPGPLLEALPPPRPRDLLGQGDGDVARLHPNGEVPAEPLHAGGAVGQDGGPGRPLLERLGERLALPVEHRVGDVGARHRQGAGLRAAVGHRLHLPEAAQLAEDVQRLPLEGVVAGGVVEPVAGPLELQPALQRVAREVEDAAAEELPGLHRVEPLPAGPAGHEATVEREVAEHLADLAEEDGVPEDGPRVLRRLRVEVGG